MYSRAAAFPWSSVSLHEPGSLVCMYRPTGPASTVACSAAAATAQAVAAKIRSEPRTTYAATDVV